MAAAGAAAVTSVTTTETVAVFTVAGIPVTMSMAAGIGVAAVSLIVIYAALPEEKRKQVRKAVVDVGKLLEKTVPVLKAIRVIKEEIQEIIPITMTA